MNISNEGGGGGGGGAAARSWEKKKRVLKCMLMHTLQRFLLCKFLIGRAYPDGLVPKEMSMTGQGL